MTSDTRHDPLAELSAQGVAVWLDDLSRELKQLLRDLGGGAKTCAFAVSDPSTILRIIEQPDTPVDMLRMALRLNGLAVLNQECKLTAA